MRGRPFLVVVISGGAAMQTAVTDRNLEVQSRMSDAIFFDPVAPSLKSVYIDIKNASGNPLEIADIIAAKLQSRRYRIETDPDKAHYILQANILYLGRAEVTAADRMLNNGYGETLEALAGALAETIINSLVENVTYMAVTDVQISERTEAPVGQELKSNIKQGSSTVITQSTPGRGYLIRYRTRIVSTASKVNLKFEDALPAIKESLSSSIAGIF